MARTPLADAVGLTAADVIHKRFSALPSHATVAQVRDWFAASTHRQVAFFAHDGRYAGSLTRDELGGDLDPTTAAGQLARPGPTIAPDAPAQAAYELAVAADGHRLPVVDQDGILTGVIGVTEDLAGFCGVGS